MNVDKRYFQLIYNLKENLENLYILYIFDSQVDEVLLEDILAQLLHISY